VIGDDFAHTLAAAQCGDEAAFEILWRDLNPALVCYLRLFAGASVAGSVQSVEDLAAETWLQVVRGLRSFSGDVAGWRGWVLTIARHRVFDQSRSARRRREAAERQPCAREQYAADAADEALERVSTDRVMAALAQLPGMQAEVIALRVLAGLPADVVGQILGCSPGAVRVTAHRALKRLAGTMTDEGVTL
jgi:RNA polymerase sigma-70 factor (ECF subfamily)